MVKRIFDYSFSENFIHAYISNLISSIGEHNKDRWMIRMNLNDFNHDVLEIFCLRYAYSDVPPEKRYKILKLNLKDIDNIEEIIRDEFSYERAVLESI